MIRDIVGREILQISIYFFGAGFFLVYQITQILKLISIPLKIPRSQRKKIKQKIKDIVSFREFSSRFCFQLYLGELFRHGFGVSFNDDDTSNFLIRSPNIWFEEEIRGVKPTREGGLSSMLTVHTSVVGSSPPSLRRGEASVRYSRAGTKVLKMFSWS